MKTLVAVIILTLPHPSKYVEWGINLVPTQVQLKFKYGLEVSYHAKKVPCETTTPAPGQMLMIEDSDFMQECYLILDVNDPQYIRHPGQWQKVSIKKALTPVKE